METTLVHLSDLHLGSDLRSADGRRQSPEELARTLAQDVAQELRESKLDCLVVSGDFITAKKGSDPSSSLEVAQNFLLVLREELSQRNKPLEPSQIVLVPGNHEIDWTGRAHFTGPIRQRREGFKAYERFFRTFYGSMHLPKPDVIAPDLAKCFFTTWWSNRDVFVLGLNSCIVEGPATAGIGQVEREQFERAIRLFAHHPKGWKDCAVRVAVTHHNLLPMEWEGLDKNSKRIVQSSLIRNAEVILRLLADNGFQVVLHGHQHEGFYATVTRYRPIPSRPAFVRSDVLVLGIGSPAVRKTRRRDAVPRQYQLLRFRPGEVEVHLRVIEGDRFERRIHDVLPLLPPLESEPLRRVVSGLQARRDARLCQALRQSTQNAILVEGFAIGEVLPDVLREAGNVAIGTAWLPPQPAEEDLPPSEAEQDVLLQAVRQCSTDGERCGIVQVFVGAAKAGPNTMARLRKALARRSRAGIETRWLSGDVYANHYRDRALDVLLHVQEFLAISEDELQRFRNAFEQDPARMSIAAFGSKTAAERFIGLILNLDADGQSASGRRIYVFLFGPARPLLVEIDAFLADLWRSAQLASAGAANRPGARALGRRGSRRGSAVRR